MIKFKEYFLIKLKPNHVAVEDLLTGQTKSSDVEFSNDRLLITNTNEPESSLKELINKITPNALVTINRTIIINPLHPNINEFTETEKMVFRDLAVNLGAKNIHFVFNKDILGKHLDLKLLKNQTEA
jgi:hypothetical protein